MIEIDKLTEDQVGRWVEYKSRGGDKVERGRIKSWNDSGIFVVYHCAGEWHRFYDYTAAHTSPEDLEFLASETVKELMENI